MKRDMELVRKIPFALESLEGGFASHNFTVEDYDADVVGFHIHLLGQAGFLKVSDTTHQGSRSPSAVPRSLTWEGYEFLDLARDDTRWNRAVGKVKTAAGSVSVAVLTQFLTHIAKQAIGVL